VKIRNGKIVFQNWLITGGCGFIGRNLVKSLLDEGGYRITIIDNLTGGTRDDLAAVTSFREIEPKIIHRSVSTACSAFQSGFSQSSIAPVLLIKGDILDESLAIDAAQDADVIVHLAANTGVGPSVENPRKDCMNNVIGTLNYLEAARCRRVKRFIFASSGAPVGECTPPIHEELAPHPVSPYGASKLSGEAYCSAYYHAFGIETVALRFGNVYGPFSGHKDSVVAKFIKNAIKREPLTIYGDGRQTRDFIFIDDLIEAIKLSVASPGVAGEIFQIATSRETTVGELVDILIPIFSETGTTKIIVDHAEKRKGDVKRNFSNTAKAEKLLNWRAAISLEKGLRKTVYWFLSKNHSIQG